MNNQLNSLIRHILIGFAFVLGLVVFASWKMGTIADTVFTDAEHFYQQPFLTATTLKRAQNSVLKINIVMQKLMLNDATKFYQQYKVIADTLDSDVEQDLLYVKDLKGQQAERIVEIQRVYQEWKSLRHQILNLLIANDYDRALQLLTGRANEKLNYFTNLTNYLINISNTKADRFLVQIAHQERMVTLWTFAFAFLALLTLCYITFTLRALVNKSLESERTSAKPT